MKNPARILPVVLAPVVPFSFSPDDEVVALAPLADLIPFAEAATSVPASATQLASERIQTCSGLAEIIPFEDYQSVA